MTDIEAIKNTTAVLCTRSSATTSLDAVLLARSNVLIMTQQAEDAVLNPADCGGWPQSLRTALAARIATHAALPQLASHYKNMTEGNPFHDLSDPSCDGSVHDLAKIVAFLDSVSIQPREIKASDIQQLQEASVTDADIVRLTELIAFMAYQTRLINGLMLLARGAA